MLLVHGIRNYDVTLVTLYNKETLGLKNVVNKQGLMLEIRILFLTNDCHRISEFVIIFLMMQRNDLTPIITYALIVPRHCSSSEGILQS